MYLQTHLRIVFQDDRDVHVDDDEEADDQVWEEECDAHGRVAAVAGLSCLVIVLGAVLLVDDAVQDPVPSGACWHLQQVFRLIISSVYELKCYSYDWSLFAFSYTLENYFPIFVNWTWIKITIGNL